MEYWQNIYSHFDLIAFSAFGFDVHWYGIMYASALLLALFIAKWMAKKYKMDISQDALEDYFIWIAIGVVLGARVGYIIFYAPNTIDYVLNPLNIFNPFVSGEFVGIRGMSYHGALLGYLISTYLFAKKRKFRFWFLMDISSLSIPLGYVFGRVGNFLNKELIGRATEMPWGIYVDGVLRHPSQLYEAFFEGIVVFIILFFARAKIHFIGGITLLYGVTYGTGRFISEFFREPDSQIGYVFSFLTLGQILSLCMVMAAFILYPKLKSMEKS